jgi:hypothetical protein
MNGLILIVAITYTASQPDDGGWTSDRAHTVNQQCYIDSRGRRICTPQSAAVGNYYQQQAIRAQQQATQQVSSAPGPQGPAGPRGERGLPGPIAQVNIGEIVAQVRESFEPLKMTEIDYDIVAGKLSEIIRVEITEGRLPELRGPPGRDAETLPVPIEAVAGQVFDIIDRRDEMQRTMPFGLTAIEFGMSALGIGSGTALPIWGLLLLAKTLRRFKSSSDDRPPTSPPPGAPPEPNSPNDDIDSRRTIPFPVAVDAPPTPQYRGVDQRFVSVEKDSYEQAHAFAQSELGRRFPSQIDIFEAEKALISQYLAGAS